MYEVLNRLNTGGINLRTQEIRTSMYHSRFYDMLYHINADPRWRDTLGSMQPDLHMKDIETILRGFAMLIDGEEYTPSMVRFLNQFSKKCEGNTEEKNTYLGDLFDSFLEACTDLPADAFINKKNKRFNIALYEAVFAAACQVAFVERRRLQGRLSSEALRELEADAEFVEALLEGTTRTANVQKRLNRARTIVGAL
jgi:hypothetical protein